MDEKEKKERDKLIIKMTKELIPQKEIALKFGMSTRAVREVLEKHGVKSEYQKAAMEKRKQRIEAVNDLRKSGMRDAEIARTLGKRQSKIAEFPKPEFIEPNLPNEDMEDAEIWNSMETRFEKYARKFFAENKIKVKLDTDKWIGIALFADQHFGHEGVDYIKARQDAEIIRDNPYMFAVLAGDMIDNFIKTNILEAIINATNPPKTQMKLSRYYLETLTPEKIIAAISGNHDLRTKEVSGLDVISELMKTKRVHYSPYEFLLELEIGTQTYTIYMRHKYRFNSNFNLTHSCKQLLKEGDYDADVVALAHTHTADWETFLYKGKTTIALRPGTYKVCDPFNRKAGYKTPQPIMPVLVFNPNKRFIQVLDDIEMASEFLTNINAR